MKAILILTVFLALSIFCKSQSLSGVVSSNAPAYKQVKINGETYAQYAPFHKAVRYDTVLLITNTPDQITELVKNNFKKIIKSECIEYFSIFNQNQNYTQIQIDSVLKQNGVKAVVKIGWNKDFYNSGSNFYVAFNSYVNSSWGSSRNKSGTACTAYIDFFDKESTSEPFVRIEASAHSSSSISHKEKALANSIFGNSLKGLRKYGIVLSED